MAAGTKKNALYLPKAVAELGAAMVQQETALSSLVNRDIGTNGPLGGGGKNRTIDVKIPTALVARTRGIDDVENNIVVDYINEQTVPLTLGHHAYNAVGLSEGDMTLDLKNFGSQVLKPQAEAVASYIENLVRSTLSAEPDAAGIGGELEGKWDVTNPVKFFTALRKYLRDRGIPSANLNVAVGTGVYAAALDANLVTDASASGSTAALRDANIGKLRGFNIMEDADLADGEIAAWHRDAFTLGIRAPKVPEGATFGSVVSESGFQMRYLRDYDANKTEDRSILGTFVGIAKMPLYKIVRTQPSGVEGDVAYTTGSASVVAVEGGAAVRAVVAV